MTIVLRSARLRLREMTIDDAPTIHALLTDPVFVAMVGDRGVHDVDDARRAIVERYRPGYARDGFGLWLIERAADGRPLGTAGLLRREGLDDVDIGYALLPAARGEGYALEAVRAMLDWAAGRGIAPIVAVVVAENAPSRAILERVGMTCRGPVRLPGATRDVLLYRFATDAI